MKRLLIFATFFFLSIMLFFNCDNSTGPGPEFVPKIEEFSNSGLSPYFDISGQTIYVALGYQGLWKRPIEAGNGAWEFVAFYDSTKKKTVEDVSINGNSILISRGYYGIWRSLDGGKTWFKSDSGIVADREGVQFLFVSQIRRSPFDKQTLAAQVGGQAIFISNDDGNTWEKTYGIAAPWIFNGWGMRWHPYKEGELWFRYSGTWGTGIGYILNNMSKNLKAILDLKVIDGTDEFNSISSFSFNQENTDSILITTSIGVSFTGDGGFNWSKFTLPDSFDFTPRIREIPDKPGYYILRKSNLDQHLVYTTDNFKTFKTYSVTSDPDTKIWYCTDQFLFYGGKLFLSTNKGIESIPISEFE